MMSIEPVRTAPDLTAYRGIIFTSVHSVPYGIAGLDCYVVGQATARAARAVGMNVLGIAPDAQTLIREILADGEPGPLLHLRGEHARGDIAGSLTRAGCPTDEAVVYLQVEQPISDQAKQALSGDSPVIVPLFSPRSAQLFLAQSAGTAPIWAVAISEAAAQELRTPRIARLSVANTPDAKAMLKAIEGLMDAAT